MPLAHRLALLLVAALIPAATARGQAGDSVRATVSGLVYDSLARQPLARATVQLVDADNPARVPFSATSDSAGRFALGAVPTGRYMATFLHPMLDSLGLRPPTYLVQVRAAAPVRFDLATPPPQRVRAAYCGAQAVSDSTGVLLGYLRDTRAQGPAGTGTVAAEWLEVGVGARGITREVARRDARADSTGWFVLCGVPLATEVSAHAARGADSTGRILVKLPTSGLVRRDFYVGPSESARVALADSAVIDSGGKPVALDTTTIQVRRGTGRLAGTIRGPYGQPLRNARVTVAGASAEALTDERGEFALRGLPEGTQTLSARAVGYFPVDRPVDVFADSAAQVQIDMASVRSVLDTIRVVGKKVQSRKIAEFEDRRRRFPGTALDSIAIARNLTTQTTTLMRQAPSMVIVPVVRRGREFWLLRVRGPGISGGGLCLPVVYVDGMPIFLQEDIREINTLVQPSDIAAMEFYTAGQAPMEFTRLGACASIVITTKW